MTAKFTKIIFTKTKSEEAIRQWLKEHGFARNFKIIEEDGHKTIVFNVAKYKEKIAKAKLDEHVIGILHYRVKKAPPGKITAIRTDESGGEKTAAKIKISKRKSSRAESVATPESQISQEVIRYPEGTIIPKSISGKGKKYDAY